MILIKRFSVFLFALLLCLQVQAQSAKDDKVKQSYLVQLLYLGQSSTVTGVIDQGLSFKYFTEDKFYQINAMPGSLTRALKYEGLRQMGFYDANKPLGEDVAPVLVVDLGAPGSKVVLLNKSSSGKLSTRVIDVQAANFPKNTVRVLNFSRQPIRAKVDESDAGLKSMAFQDFSVKNKKPRFMIRLAIAGKNDEEVYVIENRRMAMRQGDRKLLLLYHKANARDEVTYTLFNIPVVQEAENYSDEDSEAINPDDFNSDAYTSAPE